QEVRGGASAAMCHLTKEDDGTGPGGSPTPLSLPRPRPGAPLPARSRHLFCGRSAASGKYARVWPAAQWATSADELGGMDGGSGRRGALHFPPPQFCLQGHIVSSLRCIQGAQQTSNGSQDTRVGLHLPRYGKYVPMVISYWLKPF